jgi:hypothetical protein
MRGGRLNRRRFLNPKTYSDFSMPRRFTRIRRGLRVPRAGQRIDFDHRCLGFGNVLPYHRGPDESSPSGNKYSHQFSPKISFLEDEKTVVRMLMNPKRLGETN